MTTLMNEHNFQFPPTNLLSAGNNIRWRSIKPSSGLAMLSDQSAALTFTIQSSSAALVSNTLYIKATYVLVDEVGSNIGPNTYEHTELGLAALIESDNMSWSGVETKMSQTKDYPALLSTWYTGDTLGTKQWKKQLEGFGTKDRLQTDGSGVLIHHPFNCTFATPQHILLPAITGGVNVSFNIGRIEDFIPNLATGTSTSGRKPARVLLQDISCNYAELELDNEYIQQIVSDLAAGGKLWHATVDMEQQVVPAVEGNMQQIVVNTRRAKSVQSWRLQWRKPANIADKTRDRALINSHCDLSSFDVEIAGQRISPKGRKWQLNLASNKSGTIKDPEAWYLQYLTAAGGYGSELNDVVFNPAAGLFSVGTNFAASSDQSNVWGDGMDCSNSDGKCT
ncbi:hypothetical protein DFS34DRAFT_85362 [Phlyctochytrium arcticum]|nr:hypothetical protein DFS34DRAFT_85362 [Phlyctochytrium arcticum]